MGQDRPIGPNGCTSALRPIASNRTHTGRVAMCQKRKSSVLSRLTQAPPLLRIEATPPTNNELFAGEQLCRYSPIETTSPHLLTPS